MAELNKTVVISPKQRDEQISAFLPFSSVINCIRSPISENYIFLCLRRLRLDAIGNFVAIFSPGRKGFILGGK